MKRIDTKTGVLFVAAVMMSQASANSTSTAGAFSRKTNIPSLPQDRVAAARDRTRQGIADILAGRPASVPDDLRAMADAAIARRVESLPSDWPERLADDLWRAND